MRDSTHQHISGKTQGQARGRRYEGKNAATDRLVYIVIWLIEYPRDTILRWDVDGAHAMEILSRQPPSSPARHLEGYRIVLVIGQGLPEAS